MDWISTIGTYHKTIQWKRTNGKGPRFMLCMDDRRCERDVMFPSTCGCNAITKGRSGAWEVNKF